MRSPISTVRGALATVVALTMALVATSCAASVSPVAEPATEPAGASSAPTEPVAAMVEPTPAPTPPEQLERVVFSAFEPSSCSSFTSLEGLDEAAVRPACGWLSTPMLGTDDDIAIRLPVMVFQASGDDPAPDPVVYLHGGPAGGLVEYAAEQYDAIVAPFVEDRDVVLFDQRGSGLSKPTLVCQPAQNFWSDPTEDDDFEYIERRARTCAWRLRNYGIQLAEFNADRSADDVMVLARELGYEQVNLIGTSWGGYLATRVMHHHPDLVRSAILNSPLSYQTDLSGSMPGSYLEAIEGLQAACDGNPDCAARHGDIVARFSRVVATLDAEPLTMRMLSEPWWGNDSYEFEVELTGEELAHLIFGLLYSPEAIASVPDMLLDLERGDVALATRLASAYGWGWGFDFGFLTYMCTDVVPASSLDAVAAAETGHAAYDRIDDVPDGRGHTAPALCRAMKVEPEAPAAIDDPPTAPALVFSGRLDPITAYSSGEDLASILPAAQFVGFDDLSHGVLQDDCASRIAVAFVAEPGATVPSGCAESRPAFAFAQATLADRDPVGELITVASEITVGGATVIVDVPEGWWTDSFDQTRVWWRDEAPYDYTAIVLMTSTGDYQATDELAVWLEDALAFEMGSSWEVVHGGVQWTRRELGSPFGMALVALVRGDHDVVVLLQAYPDEIERLEPYLAMAAGLATVDTARPAK